MKKILLSLTATVFLISNSFGQSNNPHNQLGIDVVAVTNVIYKDYTEGKIKDVTQETLDYYFEKYLSKYPKLELANFNTLFGILKNSDNTSIIKNAGFSEEGTAFLNKTLKSYSITKLVDEVKSSKISAIEKENILSVLAINYNLIKPFSTKSNQPSSGKGPNSATDFYSLDHIHDSHYSEGLPTVIYGGIGFAAGSAICGLPCGFAGGILGLIFGGWANDRGNTTYGSSSSGSSSSGSNGGSSWSPQP